MSVIIKYSELGLNKYKAMQDFAVFYLIFIPVIYLFFKHLDWNNPLIQHCLLNAYLQLAQDLHSVFWNCQGIISTRMSEY